MKKLIMMFAITAVAVFANAAEYNWGLGSCDITGPNGEKTYSENLGGDVYQGGYAMLFLGTVTASSSAFNTTDAKFITSAGWDDVNLVYGNQDPSAGVTSDLVTSTASGQAYSIVLLDKTVGSLDGYSGNYVILTGTSDDPIRNVTTEQMVAQFSDYTTVIGGNGLAWSSMTAGGGGTGGDIPEPTSGILLLVGGSLLALRRKQK